MELKAFLIFYDLCSFVPIQIVLRTEILQMVNSVPLNLSVGGRDSIYSVREEEMWEGSKEGY